MTDSLEVLSTKFDAFVQLCNERRVADQRALELKAADYNGRLDSLNHVHRRIETDKATFVNREVFDVQIGELRKLVYIGVGIVATINVVALIVAGMIVWE